MATHDHASKLSVGAGKVTLTYVKASPCHPVLDYTLGSSQMKGKSMSTMEPVPTGSTEGPERVPMMQRILDNPFLLLFLGVTIPTVLYIIWGVMEVASIPLSK